MAHQPILFKLLEKPVPIKGFAPLIPNTQPQHFGCVWDIANSSGVFNYSADRLTVTRAAGDGLSDQLLRATLPGTSGYFELTITSLSNNCNIGLTSASAPLADWVGDIQGVGWLSFFGWVRHASSTIATLNTYAAPVTVGVYVNAGKLYYSQGGVWENSANPSAGTGGIDISGFSDVTIPAISPNDGIALTANFGASPFAYPIPTGGTSWDGSQANATNAYSLSCSTGTFSLTGANAAVTAQRLLAGSTSAYALTGIAASLAVGVPATRGVFTLIGNPATITAQRKLTGATGAFTLSGQSATLAHGFKISATTATFALTGYSVALPIARKLAVTTCAFVLTGNAAALQKGFTLAGATGQFTLTGNAAALKKATRFIAATGAFSLTGSSATLAVSVGFSTGQFTLSGIAANLKRGLRLTASTGMFAVTGNAATLTKAGINSYALTAATGAFSLAGQAALLKRGLLLSGTRGAFALTGYVADVVAARRLGAAPGSFVIIGRDANLIEFSPNAVTYPLAGVDQPYPGGVATYPLTAAQDYPLDAAQTYPLADVPQQYPLAS